MGDSNLTVLPEYSTSPYLGSNHQENVLLKRLHLCHSLHNLPQKSASVLKVLCLYICSTSLPFKRLKQNADKLHSGEVTDDNSALVRTRSAICLSTPRVLSYRFIVLPSERQTHLLIVPSLCILLKNSCCCNGTNSLAY